MKYRADIDGLRALAILPVVLFHLDIPYLTGGYVGVDVFFVISGYLITSIILKEIVNGNFSFGNFFLRRVRRLFPAAFVVYIFTIVAFAFLFPPSFFKEIPVTTLSSLFFVSNVYFWQQGGYFGGDLALNPLLHTWSLSVEEQFYLIFPISLIIVFKCVRSPKLILLLFAFPVILSILLAVKFAPSATSFAGFYLLPTRVYELGLGAFLAALTHYNYLGKYKDKTVLRTIGFGMIMLSIFTYDKAIPFPSFYALLPVIGTCLIIYTNNQSGAIYTLLTNKITVYIGAISYSMYLWHWPLVVIREWVFPNEYFLISSVIVLFLTFLFSHASYIWIETPYRSQKRVTNRVLKNRAIVGYVFLILISVFFYHSGNNAIVDPSGEISTVYKTATEPEPFRDECTNRVKNTLDPAPCFLKEPLDHKPNIFIWGDSHGSAFMPALEETSKDYNVFFSNNAGCPPIYGISRPNNPYGDCEKVNELVWQHIKNSSYELVVIVGAFNNYLNWEMLGHLKDENLSSEDAFVRAVKEQEKLFLNLNIDYVYVPQGPRFGEFIPKEFVRRKILGFGEYEATLERKEYEGQAVVFNENIKDKLKNRVLYSADVYCGGNICKGIHDGFILYKDSHHISNYFASKLSPMIHNYIKQRTNDDLQ